jgi:23S rRNA pseudouridine1911/1915/1917 synthase
LPAHLSPAARSRIARLDRLALHARVLGFTHPVRGERLRFEAPVPALFGELLALLRT